MSILGTKANPHTMERGGTKTFFLACAVLALAALGVAGSLYLSLGLDLRACPLCFYQRTFMMAVLAVLAVGLAVDPTRAGLFCLLNLPLAFGGLGVAAFHEYLVVAGKLECPAGIFSLGTAPAQSLTAFALLVAATVAGAWTGRNGLSAFPPGAILGAVILGLLLSWGSVASSPPMSPRRAPYDPVKEPFNTCRPPFRTE